VIDRHFTRAAIWCLIAAAFSWVGLMHSAILKWGAAPDYATGWLAAAAIAFSARWWRGDLAAAPPAVSQADKPAANLEVQTIAAVQPRDARDSS
jgi:hypothetical protein